LAFESHRQGLGGRKAESPESFGRGYCAFLPLDTTLTLAGDPVVTPSYSIPMAEGGNQVGDPFVVPRVYPPEGWEEPDTAGRFFTCCKTGARPYDLLVTAALLRLQHRFERAAVPGVKLAEAISLAPGGPQHVGEGDERHKDSDQRYRRERSDAGIACSMEEGKVS